MEDIIYNMIFYFCPRLLSCEENSDSQHDEDFLKVMTFAVWNGISVILIVGLKTFPT